MSKDKKETHPKEKVKEQSKTHGGKTDEVKLQRKEYEELLKRLKEMEAVKDKLLHSAADYENAKKRLTREKDEFVKFAKSSLLQELIPVLDNLERAIAHAGELKEEQSEGIASGVERVYKQIFEVLKSQGLKRLETVGQVFDPHFHEAVAYVQEKGKDHEIIEELQAGYVLHDRLLRAAKVRVRMAPVATEENKGEGKEEEIT